MYYLPGDKFEPVKIDEIFSFGSRGSGPGKFELIDAIVTDKDGNIYIGDKQGFIHKFSSEGKFIGKIGSQGSGKGQFYDEVKGIAIDSRGRIIAADEFNNRINIFGAEGNFITSFGKKGFGNGEFMDPSGVAVDSDDNIYIVDSRTLYIQKFTKNLVFIKKFGGPSGRYYADMTYMDEKIYGSEEGKFNKAESIACIGNLIYAADEGNSRVQVFDLNGSFIRTIGSSGIGKGKFYDEVEGISSDSDGNIYVVNESKGKWGSINVYDKDYNPILQFQANSYMVSPDGMQVDNVMKRIYVVDQGNWKVRVFDLEKVKARFVR
jgi:DNA-binding beta-propeller fold protein YncE